MRDTFVNWDKSVLTAQRNCRNTIVWFGGISEGFLNVDKISGDFNSISVRDVDNNWYINGIKGLGESFQESVEIIRKETVGRKVICGGQSSGGYAALRFAHALKANLCIAFAPQTAFRPGIATANPFVEIPSVEELYLNDPPTFPVIIHLSRSEKKNNFPGKWDDWMQIDAIKDLDNIVIVRHPYDVHAVTMPLYGEGRFYKTIFGTISMYL